MGAWQDVCRVFAEWQGEETTRPSRLALRFTCELSKKDALQAQEDRSLEPSVLEEPLLHAVDGNPALADFVVKKGVLAYGPPGSS